MNTGSGTSGLLGSWGSGASTAGSVYGIANDVRSGTPTGYAQAGIGSASLANKAGAFGGSSDAWGQGLGAAGAGVGIYQGIQQGGAAGYGKAAANAATIYAGSAAAWPLAAYNFVENDTASGRTGSDAAGGAETGAEVGAAFGPIGMGIGAIIGGAAGAIASAFGPGAVDPENANFNNYTQVYNKTPAAQQAQLAASVQNPYLPLAGYFDLRSNQMGPQNPIYSSYGRQGEQKFTNDLISKVNTAKAQGISDPSQVYSSVIQPWISSMGTWNDPNKNAMTGILQNMTTQVLNGTYKQNFKATGGDTPFKNG